MGDSYVADIAIIKSHRDHAFVDGLDVFLRTRKALFGAARWVNFTTVHVRLGRGKWAHVVTRGTFAIDRRPKARLTAYDGIVITNWSLAVGTVRKAWLDAKDDGFVVPGFADDPIAVSDRLSAVRVERWTAGTEWSSVRLFASMKPAVTLPDRFWSSYGSTTEVACSSGEDLVRHWTGIADWQQANGWGRGFIMECEDRRGRISDISLSDELVGELDIRAESAAEDPLRLDLRLDGDAGVRRVRAAPAGEPLRWRHLAGADWASATCFLVSSRGEVIDEVGPIRRAALPTSADVGVSPSELEAAVLAGECGEREMKSWRLLDADGESRKANPSRVREHVRRAACALANGAGGRLLVGVDEAGELDGPLLPPEGASDARDTALRWAAAVRSACVEEVNPTPAVHVRIGSLRGRYLLVLDVAPGEQRPYLTTAGQCYVRDGARSRPASHQEVVDLVRRGAKHK